MEAMSLKESTMLLMLSLLGFMSALCRSAYDYLVCRHGGAPRAEKTASKGDSEIGGSVASVSSTRIEVARAAGLVEASAPECTKVVEPRLAEE